MKECMPGEWQLPSPQLIGVGTWTRLERRYEGSAGMLVASSILISTISMPSSSKLCCTIICFFLSRGQCIIVSKCRST